MPRLCLYLNEAENEAVRERAEDEGTSVSGLVRVALRRLLGLPVPARYLDSDYILAPRPRPHDETG